MADAVVSQARNVLAKYAKLAGRTPARVDLGLSEEPDER